MNNLFDLIEHTHRNIFLTGKAGTGKTTFLNEFVKKTRKKHIVVAPTGIAAINAGGVTIHSMFGLPLRTFVPTFDEIDRDYAMNIPDLLPHFKYRRDKLKLLREVEIIIIDEVSMLRADVLDMMDLSLQHIRRIPAKFGGVQMLFIGDLYQLPPVLRQENESILLQYYNSPFFFDAKSLQQVSVITIELKHVYRQKDKDFLEILNHIRDARVTANDLQILNKRVNTEFEPGEEAYVYLCSHNRMADAINRKKLDALPGKSFFFNAEIKGDFKESQYPNDETLELRVGAQIMFIRNDTTAEKKYFNGKLAEVTSLTHNEIGVVIDGTDKEIILEKETWEQKKYSLDKDRNIREDVLGSFVQFPVKLAWAVTIHKSQGLTFDRLIIDAGRSFASGQVYVALSRCRTLEGIVLKSQITRDIIFIDRRIGSFHESTNANEQIEHILHDEKYDYSIRKILRYVDMRWMKDSLEEWQIAVKESRFLDKEKATGLYQQLSPLIADLAEVYNKFDKIIKAKTLQFVKQQNTWQDIQEKSKGAVSFFFKNVYEKIFSPLKELYATSKGEKGLKQYNELFKAFIDDVEEYLKSLKTLHLLDVALFDKNLDVEISAKVDKIPTHVISYQLYEAGKSIEEIMKTRNLSKGTIYTHLSKFVETGIVDVRQIIPAEKVAVFEQTFSKKSMLTLSEYKNGLPDNFTFDELKLLRAHGHYLFNRGKSPDFGN